MNEGQEDALLPMAESDRSTGLLPSQMLRAAVQTVCFGRVAQLPTHMMKQRQTSMFLVRVGADRT